jgi:hypothetical protein
MLLVVLALPAFVSIWGGWVGLGELTGFGPIRLLPGIVDAMVINSAVTLPVGVETYAVLALWVWLAARDYSRRTRDFARISAVGALMLGMAGQVAYHLMTAAGVTRAPWPVTTLVSCLPVAILGSGAALAHLLHAEEVEGAMNARFVRRLRRDDRGAVSVELVIAVPLLMLLLLVIVQFGLYLHATHIAQAAASEGLSATRVNRGSAAAGSAEAQRVLSQLGSGVLRDTTVAANRGPATASVEVHGYAVQVVPFLTLAVRAQADGPIETFTPPTAGRTP